MGYSTISIPTAFGITIIRQRECIRKWSFRLLFLSSQRSFKDWTCNNTSLSSWLIFVLIMLPLSPRRMWFTVIFSKYRIPYLTSQRGLPVACREALFFQRIWGVYLKLNKFLDILSNKSKNNFIFNHFNSFNGTQGSHFLNIRKWSSINATLTRYRQDFP